jgi:hypothetical protein
MTPNTLPEGAGGGGAIWHACGVHAQVKDFLGTGTML